MIDDRARRLSARTLAPIADRLHVAPVSLTAAGLLVGLGAAGAASARWWFLALVGWLLNRLLDGLDGLVARRADRHSDLGGYLDMLADVIVYAAIPIGVAFGRDDRGSWTAAAILLAAFYVNIVAWLYLSALLEKRSVGASTRGQSTSVAMPAGFIEGTETIIFLALLLALPAAATWIMAAMAAAVAVTAGQHARNAGRLLTQPVVAQ